MNLIRDIFGRKIRLTEERWSYIIQQHLEMIKFLKEFQTAIKEPELIVRSVYDPEVVLYYKYFKP